MLGPALVGHVSLDRYWKMFSGVWNANSGATVLENRNLPILQANAGYPIAFGQILEIKNSYATRGRPACLILPEGSSLELEASNLQFVPHAGFAVLESEPDPSGLDLSGRDLEPNWMDLPMVEQVGWGAARVLARSWCESVGAHGWEVHVSGEIARAMPKNPETLAYTALEDGRVTGMGLLLDGALHWLAGELQSQRAILQRAVFDAGTSVQFCVTLDQVQRFSPLREPERFVIWTESNLA